MAKVMSVICDICAAPASNWTFVDPGRQTFTIDLCDTCSSARLDEIRNLARKVEYGSKPPRRFTKVAVVPFE